MFRVEYELGALTGAPEPYALDVAHALLDGLVRINLAWLRRNPSSPTAAQLARSVKPAPAWSPRDRTLRDLPRVLVGGVASTADLACVRAAEWQAQGVPARAVVRAARVVVALPDGRIEHVGAQLRAAAIGIAPPPAQPFARVSFEIGAAFATSAPESYAGETLQALLQTLTRLDTAWLRRQARPFDIYRAGIVYEPEPLGREFFRDLPRLLQTRAGDCEDLACGVAAAYQVRGVPAQAVFTVRSARPYSRLYHVVVMRPDGTIEDPSRRLGMGRRIVA